MSVLNIKQAVDLGDAAIIPSLGPVRFDKVYPPESGTKKATGEPYNKQVAILVDGESEIRATFWDRMDLTDLIGQVRLISSVKGNGRLGGVSVRSNTFKGNTTMELSVSKAAVISGVQENTPSSLADSQATNLPSANPTANIPPAVAKAVVVASKLVAQGRPTYDDILAAFGKCYKDAKFVVGGGVDSGGSLLDGYLPAVQAAAATLFIASNNGGLVVGEAARQAQSKS